MKTFTVGYEGYDGSNTDLATFNTIQEAREYRDGLRGARRQNAYINKIKLIVLVGSRQRKELFIAQTDFVIRIKHQGSGRGEIPTATINPAPTPTTEWLTEAGSNT